jgi:hypothetical protein
LNADHVEKKTGLCRRDALYHNRHRFPSLLVSENRIGSIRCFWL